MLSLRALTCVGLVGLLPLTAAAQTGPVTKSNQVTASATITKIDRATRNVTLRNDRGEEDTFTAGPEVKRFDQLKVGDKINVTYYESLVFEVRKPGQASSPIADALAAGRAKNVPGGGVVTQQTRTVTVKAIDPAAPSITVVTPDGLTFTRKIEDRKNIEGVKAGDRIDITYSQALLIAAEPAK
jgi:Cu/Ag efflux protein CusF